MARKAYTPTAEQTERRQKTLALVERIAAMTEAERQAMLDAAGAPIVTCEARALSLTNACLVLSQLPGASMVGGFRQWLAAGRCVAKGQKGLAIWIPRSAPKDYGKQEGEISAADVKPRFVLGTVFDISQTVVLTAESAAESSDQVAA